MSPDQAFIDTHGSSMIACAAIIDGQFHFAISKYASPEQVQWAESLRSKAEETLKAFPEWPKYYYHLLDSKT